MRHTVPYTVPLGKTKAANVAVLPPIQTATERAIEADVSDPAIRLRRGDALFYLNEVVAWLDHVLFDPATIALTHLVAQIHASDRHLVVTADWVNQMRDGALR